MVNESKNMYIPEDTLENHQGTWCLYLYLVKHLVIAQERRRKREGEEGGSKRGMMIWKWGCGGEGERGDVLALYSFSTDGQMQLSFPSVCSLFVSFSVHFEHQVNLSRNKAAGRQIGWGLFSSLGSVHTCRCARPVHRRT